MRAQRVGPAVAQQQQQSNAFLLLVHPQKQDSQRPSCNNTMFLHGITSGSRSFSVTKEAVTNTTTATPTTAVKSEERELQDAETRVVNQGAWSEYGSVH